MSAQRFDFYGTAIDVRCDAEQVLDSVRRDFWYFRVDAPEHDSDIATAHQIAVELKAPEYPDLPQAKPLVYTPRNVTFRDGRSIYIDYFGRALMRTVPKERCYELQCTDAGLAHEIVYLTILSIAGEDLDRRRTHRVHSLGISYRGRAAIVMLPPGGGKSTLLKELIRRPGVQLLSEDSPLITREGKVLAFPLRLGFVPGNEPDVPERFLRRVDRMEFGPKVLVDIESMKDRLVDHAEPGAIFLGARMLSASPEIVPATRYQALKNLSRHCIVGLGLYQGLEFAVQHGLSDLLGRGRVAYSRLVNCNRLAKRSRLFHLRLGRDGAANADAVMNTLQKLWGE